MARLGDKIFEQAISSFQARRFSDAERSFKKMLRRQPKHVAALNLLAVTLTHLERYAEAENYLKTALKFNSNSDASYYNYGIILKALKRPNEALESFSQALSINDSVAETWNNRGTILNDLKRYEDAIIDFNKATSLRSNYSEAFCNKGKSLAGLKRYDEASAAYDRALELEPNFAEAYLGRGNVFNELKRRDEAIAAYDKALTLKPNLTEASLCRDNVLTQLKQYNEAPATNDSALERDQAEAWLGRGDVFFELKRYDDAIAVYEKALAVKPDLAEAWLGRGNVFFELKRYDEALGAYDKARVLKPGLAAAWLGRGYVLNKLKRREAAARAYAEVLKIDPQHPFTKGMFLHQKMLCCDWKGIGDLIAEIESDVAFGKLSAEPFGWQAAAKSQRSLQLCTELYNENIFPANIRASARRPLANNKKIRIGYSSGEFRAQATSQLLVGILEHHDNTRFEIYAFDNGWDDQSMLRGRINDAVHSVVNIRHLSDPSAAAAICENQIDILVNLNGYFGEQRTRVFAQRPAPIQVNYLGFPGTLGATYIDYIIADKQVIPEDHKVFYTEKVVYLPNCYQANDRKREIGTRIFSRPEFGLPEKHIVFCCFNNNYKILPDIFDYWMRILKQVEGSILWLLEDNAAAAINLRKEAVARGVNAERLVFAKRIPLPDHLARHRLADVFLDTQPYGAHTTASDALWAGLPVLTLLGETFAGKVAASLLNALDLPELITTTPEAYELMAIDLATHPEKLAAIKRKLAENRLTTPAFDTELFTKHIEAAYTTMHERYQAGLAPDHIIVPN